MLVGQGGFEAFLHQFLTGPGDRVDARVQGGSDLAVTPAFAGLGGVRLQQDTRFQQLPGRVLSHLDQRVELLALLGAQTGGVVWLLGGFLATFVLGFFLHVVSSTRAPATAALGSTVLGSAWIGLTLGFLLLLRQMPTAGRLIAFTVVLVAVLVFLLLRLTPGDPAETTAATLAAQDR